MITYTITEDIEITDVANKVNNNDYSKTIKIFSIKIFSMTHKMKQVVSESKLKQPIGFTENK